MHVTSDLRARWPGQPADPFEIGLGFLRASQVSLAVDGIRSVLLDHVD
jgi:hypothetical protein